MKMSDAWDEIQAIKSKRNSLRQRLEKRKKERQDILGTSSVNSVGSLVSSTANVSISKEVHTLETRRKNMEYYKKYFFS